MYMLKQLVTYKACMVVGHDKYHQKYFCLNAISFSLFCFVCLCKIKKYVWHHEKGNKFGSQHYCIFVLEKYYTLQHTTLLIFNYMIFVNKLIWTFSSLTALYHIYFSWHLFLGRIKMWHKQIRKVTNSLSLSLFLLLSAVTDLGTGLQW